MSSCDISVEEFWEARKKSQKDSFKQSAEKEFQIILSYLPRDSIEYQKLLLEKEQFIQKKVNAAQNAIGLLEEKAFESLFNTPGDGKPLCGKD